MNRLLQGVQRHPGGLVKTPGPVPGAGGPRKSVISKGPRLRALDDGFATQEPSRRVRRRTLHPDLEIEVLAEDVSSEFFERAFRRMRRMRHASRAVLLGALTRPSVMGCVPVSAGLAETLDLAAMRAQAQQEIEVVSRHKPAPKPTIIETALAPSGHEAWFPASAVADLAGRGGPLHKLDAVRHKLTGKPGHARELGAQRSLGPSDASAVASVAGLIFEQPQRPVTLRGVTFTANDIAGLLGLLASEWMDQRLPAADPIEGPDQGREALIEQALRGGGIAMHDANHRPYTKVVDHIYDAMPPWADGPSKGEVDASLRVEWGELAVEYPDGPQVLRYWVAVDDYDETVAGAWFPGAGRPPDAIWSPPGRFEWPERLEQNPAVAVDLVRELYESSTRQS